MTLSKTVVLSAVGLTLAGLLIAGCAEEPKPAALPSPPPETAPADETGTQAGATPPAEPAAAAIAQKTCPVMGAAIDPNLFVDHEGRRIYFCCAACVAKFKADPAKYIAKVDAELKAAGAAAGQDMPTN